MRRSAGKMPTLPKTPHLTRTRLFLSFIRSSRVRSSRVATDGSLLTEPQIGG
jgi:hypothetical protein